MASKKFKVFFNKGVNGSQLSYNKVEALTKTQAETTAATSRTKYGKEPIQITGPIEECEVVEIEAENAEAAACAVVHLLGASQSPEVQVAETSAVETKNGA